MSGFRATITQAERTIEVEEEQTLLLAALEAGIAYPHGCRSGRCGSCKSRLVEGSVSLLPHTSFSLTEDERERGLILACRAQPTSDITVRGLTQGAVNHPVVGVEARIEQKVWVTHDIVELRLQTDRAIAYAPGQYIRLQWANAPARDYSMAPSEDPNVMVFNIRTVPGGVTSMRIGQEATIGDIVALSGPFGEAYLREDHTRPILAIAGGSGMAPILSIVERAVALDMNQPIHVYHGVRDTADIYGLAALRILSERHGNLHFHVVLSIGKAGPYRKGFVHESVAADIADMAGWKLYVAGPPAMVEAISTVCAARRLRPEDFHADVFFTPEGEKEGLAAGG